MSIGKSKRHHYIPQFLINGFTRNNKVYVYDKKKDRILSKQLPPKSIFFEEGRNTIEFPYDDQSTFLEDKLYSKIDNDCGKIIKKYQSQKLSEIVFTDEDIAAILFFKVSLFWRIPRTDETADDVLNRTEITIQGEKNDFLKSNSAFRKVSRAGLFKHHVDEIRSGGTKEGKVINIHELEEPSFVLGDYPFTFRKHISFFKEFNDHDILFAISSNRIYTSTRKAIRNFSTASAICYNALVILYSVRYVCSCNIEILKKSVELLKSASIENLEEIYRVAFCES